MSVAAALRVFVTDVCCPAPPHPPTNLEHAEPPLLLGFLGFGLGLHLLDQVKKLLWQLLCFRKAHVALRQEKGG